MPSVPWSRGAAALLVVLAAAPARAVDLLDGAANVSGFIETREAIWTQSDPVKPLRIPGISDDPPDNRLAVARETLQLSFDYTPSPELAFHGVFRGVWEPRYRIDAFASDGSRFGRDVLDRNFYDEPPSWGEPIRELWAQWSPSGSHSIRVGRQIVNWGESLAFRVADVINPNDSRFNLFFLDPQDSRIPQWMVQGIHQFLDLPGSPSFEWIVLPPLEPEHRRVNDFAPTGARWAVPPETRQSRYPALATAPGDPALWTVQRAVLNARAIGAPGGAVDFRFLDDVQKAFPHGTSFGGRLRFSLGGLNLALFDWYGYELQPVVKDLGLSDLTIADYRGVLGRPDLADVYTALGVPVAAQSAVRLDRFRFLYPRQNVLGMTGNYYLAALKAVTRFELVLRPKKRFQVDGFDRVTGAITNRDGLVRRDEVQWQIAFDFSGLYWPALNRESDFSFSVEYTQAIVPDPAEGMRAGVFETPLRQVTDTLSVRGSTAYFYNCVQPSVTAIWQPEQGAWAVVPALGLAAPFDSNLTAELRYVTIGGRSAFDGLGLFQRKDFVMFSLRYGF
jgi:hypothetical protein